MVGVVRLLGRVWEGQRVQVGASSWLYQGEVIHNRLIVNGHPTPDH